MANKKKKNNSKNKNVAKNNVKNKKVSNKNIQEKVEKVNDKNIQKKVEEEKVTKDKVIKENVSTKKNEEKKVNTSDKKAFSKDNDVKLDKKIQEKKVTINKAKRELVYADSGDNEIGKLLKVVLIVTAVIIVFYFVTSFVTKKALKVKESEGKQKTVIQYDNLIIGSLLNKDGEYYVLIQDDEDEHLSEYKTSIQMASIIEDAPKFYYADLNDSFNKIYLSSEANYDSNLSNFRVKGTTLVKVSDHQIKDTYDNYDDIKSVFSNLQ